MTLTLWATALPDLYMRKGVDLYSLHQMTFWGKGHSELDLVMSYYSALLYIEDRDLPLTTLECKGHSDIAL